MGSVNKVILVGSPHSSSLTRRNQALVESLYTEWARGAGQITTTSDTMAREMSSHWTSWGAVATGAIGQVKSAAQSAFDAMVAGAALIEAYQNAGIFVNLPGSFATSEYSAAVGRQAGGYRGFAAGGVSNRPAIFGEGGEPEIAGSVDFMARALRGAMQRESGSGGANTFHITITANSEEGGRSAARGFSDEMKRRGVKMRSI